MKYEFKITFPAGFSETISALSKEMALLPMQKAGVDQLLNSAKKQDRNTVKKSHSELTALINKLEDIHLLREAKLQMIYNEILCQFNSCDPIIKSSTAGQLFERQLHEFVKNSVDAQATDMMFTLEIHAQDQVEITISDNGKIEIPTKALGKYNWAEVVLLDSAKENNNQLGGCHLGLATTANFLETVGDGQLHLAQRPEGGATLTLTSSTKACDIDRFSFANYVWEIIHDLDKKSAEFKETHAVAINQLKIKYAYPETFQRNRDKIMAPVLHAVNSQIMFSLPLRKKKSATSTAGLEQSGSLGSASAGSDMFSPVSTCGMTPTVASPS